VHREKQKKKITKSKRNKQKNQRLHDHTTYHLPLTTYVHEPKVKLRYNHSPADPTAESSADHQQTGLSQKSRNRTVLCREIKEN
jgi:hypothetical protein